MAESKKRTKKYTRQELVPLSDKQQKQAEQVVAESLKDNPELFNLPESRYTVDSLVDFFVQSLEGVERYYQKRNGVTLFTYVSLQMMKENRWGLSKTSEKSA